MSKQEVCHLLLGLPLYVSSLPHEVLNLNNNSGLNVKNIKESNSK